MHRFSHTVMRFAALRALPSTQVRPGISQLPSTPTSRALWRSNLRIAGFASRNDPPPPKQPIDREAERKIAQQKLKPTPTADSTGGSAQSPTAASQKADPATSDGLRHDIDLVKETARLDEVPRESHILGLLGTVPYFATSLSTLYLGWDLTKELPTGNAVFDAIYINHDTARYLLSVIEPLQLGYGAVIISFLGAIHWGLEYAEKKPLSERTRFRYGVGLAASMVAWPTMFMPVPYALTTQFMAFVGLYFADSTAARRGWAPSWYGKYRFLLTAMVGLAIFVSLVGRARIGEGEQLTERGMRANLERTGIADHETDWAKLEAEEKERMRKEEEKKQKKAKKDAVKKKKQGGDDKGSQAGKKDAKDDDVEGTASEQGVGDESDSDKDGARDTQDQGDEQKKGPNDDDKDNEEGNGSDGDDGDDSKQKGQRD